MNEPTTYPKVRSLKFTIEDYLRAKKEGLPGTGTGRSANTLRLYGVKLQNIERMLGKPIAALGGDDVERLLHLFDEQGVTATTRNQTISALRGMFAWGINRRLHPGPNPTEGIHVPSPTSADLPKVLTRAQVDSLFEALREVIEERRDAAQEGSERTERLPWVQADTADKYVLFFKLMYFGGLRISEVLTLRRTNVMSNGVRVVGKGSRVRFVPIKDEVLRELRRFMEEHDESSYVFYGESGSALLGGDRPMTGSTARDVFRRAAERAKLPEWVTPHTLRHSAATHFLHKSRRLDVVQDFLGHSNPKTTRIYARVLEDDLVDEYQAAFS